MIARRRWKHVGGRFRGAGERLDVYHLGAEVLERGARLEVAVLGLVGYPGLGAAMFTHRGSLARRWSQHRRAAISCFAPTAALPRSRRNIPMLLRQDKKSIRCRWV